MVLPRFRPLAVLLALVLGPATAPAEEPTWPQGFDLAPGEGVGFGFTVARPGRITATVNSAGAPVRLILGRPGGGRVQQEGSGRVTLIHEATAEDVKKGVVWALRLRLAGDPEVAPSGSPSLTLRVPPPRPGGSAKGTVTLEHPPGDPKAAAAEMQGWARPIVRVASGGKDPLLAQRSADQRKLVADRQTGMLEALRSKVPAEAFRAQSLRIAGDLTGIARPAGPQPLAKPLPAGGRNLASPPSVASLSISAGQPGDPVLVSGRNFTQEPGEVHFIVANGRDVVAPVSAWADTQIFTCVPDLGGLPAFSGQVYVQRGSLKSALVPFQFIPATEFRTLGHSADRRVVDPSTMLIPFFHDGLASFFGARGYDEFFQVTRLRNGWTVDSAYLADPRGGVAPPFIVGSARAYIVDLRPGTDSPYLKVRWWYDAFSQIGYLPFVVIKGPKGTAHQ